MEVCGIHDGDGKGEMRWGWVGWMSLGSVGVSPCICLPTVGVCVKRILQILCAILPNVESNINSLNYWPNLTNAGQTFSQ